MKGITAVITNIEGKELYNRTFGHKQGTVSEQIDIHKFNNGLYFLIIQTEQTRLIQKFLITK